VLPIPYTDSTFDKLGVYKDVEIQNQDHSIAWTHRNLPDADIYFISNQKDSIKPVSLSFRIGYQLPEVWDPVTGEKIWKYFSIESERRTHVSLSLAAHQSVFIIFKKHSKKFDLHTPVKQDSLSGTTFSKPWTVQFDKNYGGPQQPVIFNELKSWSQYDDPSIRFYSGTAMYRNTFNREEKNKNKTTWIQFDSIYNIATVKVNGIDCGTLWTQPNRLNITKAVKPGVNEIEIEVSNTWANRLIGDQALPVEKRITWTTAPFRLSGKPLLPAGLTGKITIVLTADSLF
jgi:hypothetical protein